MYMKYMYKSKPPFWFFHSFISCWRVSNISSNRHDINLIIFYLFFSFSYNPIIHPTSINMFWCQARVYSNIHCVAELAFSRLITACLSSLLNGIWNVRVGNSIRKLIMSVEMWKYGKCVEYCRECRALSITETQKNRVSRNANIWLLSFVVAVRHVCWRKL